MPKRRTYNFKPLQGPTSSSNKQSSSTKGSDAPSSVNERLGELRKIESKDAAARKRQLADSVNARSVPPALHGILGVPESAPPRPKANFRRWERMRTPGPAPPKSWLAGSSTSWRPKKNADKNGHSRPKQLLRFTRLIGLSDDTIDEKPSSLTHLALKTIAASWDLLDEEDYPALADIPLRLRLRLLSYIDYYGSSISTTALKALLYGNESIPCLDLAGLIGYGNLSLKKLGKLLGQGHSDQASGDKNVVIESWNADDSFEVTLQPTLTESRFSNLTYLCLSHPAGTVSWRDLIIFSKQIPQLTHLSLAYWPRPTLTPNLTTATVSSQHSPDVTAGGSHYYSGLDQDMDEPASLLRQLSGHLLCLQWLDLEGCEEWIPAMGRLASDIDSLPIDDGWTEGAQPTPSVYTSNWKNLKYLRCAQGWLPSPNGVQGLGDSREANVIDMVLVDGITKYLKQQGDSAEPNVPSSQDVIDVERKKARIWLEREYGTNHACMKINATRRRNGLQAIEVDFGWVRRHVGAVRRHIVAT